MIEVDPGNLFKWYLDMDRPVLEAVKVFGLTEKGFIHTMKEVH